MKNLTCFCHPDVNIGTGEQRLNCKDNTCKTRRENGTGGYCNNSTRQADWFVHREEVRREALDARVFSILAES